MAGRIDHNPSLSDYSAKQLLSVVESALNMTEAEVIHLFGAMKSISQQIDLEGETEHTSSVNTQVLHSSTKSNQYILQN